MVAVLAYPTAPFVVPSDFIPLTMLFNTMLLSLAITIVVATDSIETVGWMCLLLLFVIVATISSALFGHLRGGITDQLYSLIVFALASCGAIYSMIGIFRRIRCAGPTRCLFFAEAF